MKKFILPFLVSLALAPLAWANDFTFAQAGLKIDLPLGFALLPRADIDLLYAPTRGPSFVIGNAARSVTVSYDLKLNDISTLNLAQGLKTFERVFEQRVPALAWKERKVIEQEKQQWLQLEFQSKAGGADYYNIMLITPLKDQMLVLNFSSSLAEFDKAQPQLRAVIKSIALNVVTPQLVVAPAPASPKKTAPVKKKEKAAP
ncbi:MAG: hypothetical protein WCH44_12510 [Betaproteobacteria bacterium]